METKEEIANFFNNQKGQPYPCSNQNVCCGFITGDNKKWVNFINQNKFNIKIKTKQKIILDNGETWIRISSFDSARGRRYYKIKVDKNIPEKFLYENILPCCIHYCCSFEWI